MGDTTTGMAANHFPDARKMVSIGSDTTREIPDLKLTRYACYLIAQNGDPRKDEIAFAQSYFALHLQLLCNYCQINGKLRSMR